MQWMLDIVLWRNQPVNVAQEAGFLKEASAVYKAWLGKNWEWSQPALKHSVIGKTDIRSILSLSVFKFVICIVFAGSPIWLNV